MFFKILINSEVMTGVTLSQHISTNILFPSRYNDSYMQALSW